MKTIKIPVSKEREEQFIQDQINELINDIAEMKKSLELVYPY